MIVGVAPVARRQTALNGMLSEAEMTADQKEIKNIMEKWSEVRLLSKEEAANLEPEWKEAYDRFHEKYDSDMTKMEEIATNLQRLIEPPKVEKKTKGQKKRDAYTTKQERIASMGKNLL